MDDIIKEVNKDQIASLQSLAYVDNICQWEYLAETLLEPLTRLLETFARMEGRGYR